MEKNLVLYCCLIAAVTVWAQAAPPDKLDSIDVDSVLRNPRLMTAYMQCVLGDDDGKCTTEGKDVKRRIPEMVKTGCSECTPSQLDRAIKILKHVTEMHPAEWVKLKAKYDPTGEYTKKYGDTWKQRGVNF